MKINTFDYIVKEILSQLFKNIKSKLLWHLIVYFSRKLIITEEIYKTYNKELLIIIKLFK